MFIWCIVSLIVAGKSTSAYGRTRVVICQDMELVKTMSKQNAKYIIREEIDLNGKTITIGDNSILVFRGGKFKNGKMIGTNTRIKAKNEEIFLHGYRKFRGYTNTSGYHFSVKDYHTMILEGTWDSIMCGDKWTGMDSFTNKECAGLAVNNFILLHKPGSKVVFPSGKKYSVYEPVNCSGHSVNFNGIIIQSVDFDAVTDVSIILPQGATPCELKSLYGLVVFHGNGLELRNVTIDGRASSRNEVPTLGSQCLIALSNNSNCILENVVLKDAVDCGICTYTISDCKFLRFEISNCGEHGIYTHSYKGDLLFKDCRFNNCGQNKELFVQRGMSACVKFAGSGDSDYSAHNTLKAFFRGCTFQCDGDTPVATIYADLPFAEFDHCQWAGNVRGYSVVSEDLAEKMGRLVEYIFKDCHNPCYKIKSVNTVRRLIRCSSVTNPFADAVEIRDCEIISSYADVENNYSKAFISEYEVPVFISDCRFHLATESVSIRNTIKKPRPMVFRRCEWNYSYDSSQKNNGSYYLVLSDGNNDKNQLLSIVFDSCRFDFGKYRLIKCDGATIDLNDCYYVSSYGTLIDANANTPNRINVKNLVNDRKLPLARNYYIDNR